MNSNFGKNNIWRVTITFSKSKQKVRDGEMRSSSLEDCLTILSYRKYCLSQYRNVPHDSTSRRNGKGVALEDGMRDALKQPPRRRGFNLRTAVSFPIAVIVRWSMTSELFTITGSTVTSPSAIETWTFFFFLRLMNSGAWLAADNTKLLLEKVAQHVVLQYERGSCLTPNFVPLTRSSLTGWSWEALGQDCPPCGPPGALQPT